ncbi:LRC59 protein, partial [Amia calva]|nr:LRC59 protein [Amia calva]
SSKQAQELNVAVAYFIAKDMMPFQIVEKFGFRKLVEKLNPTYNLPSRTFFSTKAVPKMYNELRVNVEKCVSEGTWYAATTDLWTSSGGGGKPYVSFTVHYLSSDFRLIVWKLTNERNHKTRFAEVRKVLDISSFLDPRKACFSDNLDATVHKCEEEPLKLLTSTDQDVPLPANPSADASGSATSLEHTDEQGGSPKLLKSITKKRLESTEGGSLEDGTSEAKMKKDLLHCSRYLALSQANTDDPLTWWKEHLREMPFLSNLARIYLCIPATSVPTERVFSCSGHILNPYRSTNERNHKTRFAEVRKVLDISSFLDPRKACFSDNLDATVHKCEEEPLKLLTSTDQDVPLPANPSADAFGSATSLEHTDEQGGSPKLLKSITKKRLESTEGGSLEDGTSEAKMKKDLLHCSRYLALSQANTDDPLTWWKEHLREMPFLSNLARIYLCIPATSVPTERVFSCSGHILNPYRSSDFCGLTHLIKLDLSKNQLVQLPPELGRLISLQHLDLYNNKLTSLPVSFAQLKNLKWLDLKDNPLEASLANVAGDCLDEKQCKLCATRVLQHMRTLQEELDRQRERRLQRERELERKKEAELRVREAREREVRKREKAEEKERKRREYDAQRAAKASKEKQKKEEKVDRQAQGESTWPDCFWKRLST